MTQDPSRRLQPYHLFFLACQDAFRDGHIDAPEQEVLNRIHHALDLNTRAVKSIAASARAQCEKDGYREGVGLEPHRVMQQARQLARQLDSEDEQGQALLEVFRCALVGEPGPTLSSEAPPATPATPAPSPTPPPEPAAATPAAPSRAPHQEPPPPPLAAEPTRPPAPSPTPSPAPPAPGAGGGYQPPPWEDPLPQSPVRGSGVPGGGELTSPEGKKGVLDSGGEEAHRAIGPYGDEASWGFGDLLSVSSRVITSQPGIWLGLALFSILASLALEMVKLGSLVFILTTPFIITVTAGTIRGDAPQDLTEAWHRTVPHIGRYAWTSLTMGMTSLAYFGAVGIVLAICSGVIGGAATALFGLVGFLWVLREILYMTLYAAQVSVLEEKSGSDALRATKELTYARSSDLIGLQAIGLGLLMMAALFGAGGLFFVLTMGSFFLFPPSVAGLGVLVMGLGMVIFQSVLTLYGQVAWTLLYMRGRQRLLLE